ncbi:hypothetical protein SLW70_12445 [Flavobacterium sp. NG2]|nr:hypothetical protein [Flavobacterium sp. NG2]WPR70736.1 hypothetical protein SLW70_12445 [Flavobacterium sp. NG2]
MAKALKNKLYKWCFLDKNNYHTFQTSTVSSSNSGPRRRFDVLSMRKVIQNMIIFILG